jgi:hypothetical protein
VSVTGRTSSRLRIKGSRVKLRSGRLRRRGPWRSRAA